ncbi:histidine kinase [Nonomuraea wenchangensis]
MDRVILLLGWFVAAGVGGTVSRHRQAYLEQAERTREETALRRAGEEPLRMARELHDSLTHSISVIKVRAGVTITSHATVARRCPARCWRSRRPAPTPCASCEQPRTPRSGVSTGRSGQ